MDPQSIEMSSEKEEMRSMDVAFGTLLKDTRKDFKFAPPCVVFERHLLHSPSCSRTLLLFGSEKARLPLISDNPTVRHSSVPSRFR